MNLSDRLRVSVECDETYHVVAGGVSGPVAHPLPVVPLQVGRTHMFEQLAINASDVLVAALTGRVVPRGQGSAVVGTSSAACINTIVIIVI